LDVKSARITTWLKTQTRDAKAGTAANASHGMPPFNISDWGIAELLVHQGAEFSPRDKCAVITKAGDDTVTYEIAVRCEIAEPLKNLTGQKIRG
jgi:hypothetical protein